MVAEFATGQHEKVAQRLQEDMRSFKAMLDDKLKVVLEAVTAELDKLNNLTVVAFDFQMNTSLLERSVTLAQAYGVKSDKIVANNLALDNYMLT
jgi:hypothetical protein